MLSYINCVYQAFHYMYSAASCVLQYFTRLHVRDLRSFKIRFKFDSDDSDSKVTGRFEIFKSAEPAIVSQATLTVQQKTSTIAPL